MKPYVSVSVAVDETTTAQPMSAALGFTLRNEGDPFAFIFLDTDTRTSIGKIRQALDQVEELLNEQEAKSAALSDAISNGTPAVAA